MKIKLELFYSITCRGKASISDIIGIMAMYGYPVTERKKGVVIGRYPFKKKDAKTALDHALIIKSISKRIKLPSVVGVRVANN